MVCWKVHAEETEAVRKGTLYVVGLPAGNLEDATLRALRVLREVNLIVATDPHRAQRLLMHYGIDTPFGGCLEGKDGGRGRDKVTGIESVLASLDNGDVALLSEVGETTTSQFAHRLVRAAMGRGHSVVSVPGPSAVVAALVTSGLPADAFVYLSCLPQHSGERRQLLRSLSFERRTLVAFETSRHLQATLSDVADTLGDRALALVPTPIRPGDEVWRGMVKEAVVHCEAGLPHGEWVLVIAGATEGERWPEAQVRAELARWLARGLSRKAAARQVAEASGWPPREVYRVAIEVRFTFESS